MQLQTSFQLIENFLFAEMRGKVSVSDISDFFTRISQSCEEFEVTRVVVEAFTVNTTRAVDKFSQLKIFEEIKFNSNHSIAWVNYNPKTKESSKATILLLKSRGIFTVELFDTVEEGLGWLLDEEVSIDKPHQDYSAEIEDLHLQIFNKRKLNCHER